MNQHIIYRSTVAKSVTLNLKATKGRNILRELACQADVLVENFRAGTMDEWGFGYEQLAIHHSSCTRQAQTTLP